MIKHKDREKMPRSQDPNGHTVVQLREMAKDLGLTGFYHLRKADLEELVSRTMGIKNNASLHEAKDSLNTSSTRMWQSVFDGSRQFIKYQGRKYKVINVPHEAFRARYTRHMAYLVNTSDPYNILAVVGFVDGGVPSTSLNWGGWDKIVIKKIM